jgi:hypothetical protein
MDHEEILRRIEEARPEILLVAFGNPKQEQWIAMHRDRLKVPVCIGVGGTLDIAFRDGAAGTASGCSATAWSGCTGRCRSRAGWRRAIWP